MICAKISTPHDPLHPLVCKRMIHGPCGPMYNMDLGCCKNSPDGSCEKGFPKEFNSLTRIGEDSFPDYRRRAPEEGGNTGQVWCRPKNRNVTVDNRNVVPYSPYLLKKFKCHINVEYCASIKSVKYLFMYQFKGEDMTTQELDFLNEVACFQARKYISCCYAYWRIQEFAMMKCHPAVYQLQIHLPNCQPVVYKANKKSAKETLDTKKYSMLEEYFATNVLYEEARSITYEEFPLKFVWDSEKRVWNKRKRITENPNTIGRMCAVHPSNGDVYYLRLLLKNRAGALSFEDLRTIDGIKHSCYKSACVALGLCESDKQWVDSLREAVQIAMPYSIRHLFCNILVHGEPADPVALLTSLHRQ